MKKKTKAFLTDFVILLLACCFSAFAVVGVMIPNGLTSGGITGIARILQKFIDVDFSILYYGLSMIVLVMVALFMGWKEVKKVLLLAIMFPAVLFVFERFPIYLLETEDVLLAAVFSGVFTGIYVGLIFWRGYASAGSDAISKILKKKLFPGVGLTKILLCIDGIVIIASMVAYGRNVALYALITQIIITRTSEAIMYGFEDKIVQLTIITDKSEEIRDYIINQLSRTLSSFDAKGGYTNKDMKQLVLLCSPRESLLVKKQLASIDPQAFVTVSKMETVWGSGRGFKDIQGEHE